MTGAPYFGRDLRNLPRTGAWYTSEELTGWCIICFTVGVGCAVALLLALSF